MSSSSPRRRSTQQLAAAHRRLAIDEQRESALAEVAKLERELVETLDAWRDLPVLRSASELEKELVARAPVNDNACPAPVDMVAVEKAFRAELATRVER